MMTWGILDMTFGGDKLFTGRPSAVGAATGAVVGLVGITPACGYVTPMFSILIGLITALCCYFAPRLTRRMGIEDRLDCFAFHGVGGVVGALLTGLFADSRYTSPNTVSGSFFGNGPLFGTQIVGVLVTLTFSVIGTTIIYFILAGLAGLLKTELSIDDSITSIALDVSQHGEKAYFRQVGPLPSTAEKVAAAIKAGERDATSVVVATSDAPAAAE